ncbi:MAG: hypothetical protein SVX43_23335 [Cyanobacteriota bacterium]|nr:hypothetical protein [Cyanobacteriota bacterium]
MENSDRPEPEPLNRTSILIAMGVTAIVLLVVAKLWQKMVSGFCKDVLNELPMEFAAEADKLLSLKLEGTVG